MMAPMMPHLAEECWQALGHEELVADRAWPEVDRSMLVEDMITLPVQVNGKKRGELTIAIDASQADVETAALGLDAVQRALAGHAPKQDRRRTEEDRQCRRLTTAAWARRRAAGRLLFSFAVSAVVSACTVQPLYGTRPIGRVRAGDPRPYRHRPGRRPRRPGRSATSSSSHLTGGREVGDPLYKMHLTIAPCQIRARPQPYRDGADLRGHRRGTYEVTKIGTNRS